VCTEVDSDITGADGTVALSTGATASPWKVTATSPSGETATLLVQE